MVYNAVLLNCCGIRSAFQHLWAIHLCIFCFTVCLWLGKYFPRKLHLNWMHCLLWLASYCTVNFGALGFCLKKCFCGRKWTVCKNNLDTASFCMSVMPWIWFQEKAQRHSATYKKKKVMWVPCCITVNTRDHILQL